MWLNWNHAAIIRHSIVHSSGIFSLNYFESNPSSPHVSALMSTLSLFLPSRPPPIPACYLHPRLPRAALTHQRTPPLICRLRPQPTPTLVSVLTNSFTRLLTINQTPQTNKLSLSVFHSGLISPGVSVPVQVPGTEQQGMSHNLGQYWARLQWTTDNWCQVATRKKKGRKGYEKDKKVSRIQSGLHRGFNEAQDWAIEGPQWVADPKIHYMFTNSEQLWLHLRVLWSYWYLLSTIRLHFFW